MRAGAADGGSDECNVYSAAQEAAMEHMFDIDGQSDPLVKPRARRGQ